MKTGSRIQLQREVFRLRGPNFQTSFWGMTVLNTVLKSINSILTQVFLLSRCDRARWRADEMASPVELLGRYANWRGSSEVRKSFSKHFIVTGVSATWQL